MIPSGTYAGRELLSIVEGIVELNKFVVDDQVIKKNKLKGIMEMTIDLEMNSIIVIISKMGDLAMNYSFIM